MSATTPTASEPRGAIYPRTAPAGTCWPAVVTWEPRGREVALLIEVERLLHRHAPAHGAVRADARTLVLLLAAGDASADDALAVRLVAEQVVAFVRAAVPGAHVHGVIASTSVPLGDVGGRVERLRRLARLADRRPASSVAVCSERALALLDVLHGVDHARAAAFASGELAPLLAYDRTHGTRLADVLEIALDVPNRAAAARTAYMHRNTFRRHLRRAQELLGGDLSDPDERLAVHVALKLVRTAPRDLTTPGGRSET